MNKKMLFKIMNKKMLFNLMSAFSIAIISAFNVSINAIESRLSNFSLDNVEALAQEADIPDCMPAKGICVYKEIYMDHQSLK